MDGKLQAPKSSLDAPIPWSSSPPEHLQRPPGAISDLPMEAIPPTTVDPIEKPMSSSDQEEIRWACDCMFRLTPTNSPCCLCGERALERLGLPRPSPSPSPPLPAGLSSAGPHSDAVQLGKPVQSSSTRVKHPNYGLRKPGRNNAPRSGSHDVSVGKDATTLSAEQQEVLRIIQTGRSVYFTGPAGTGKSVILRRLIQHYPQLFRRDIPSLGVTASTGAAAAPIGGITLLKFSGLGLGKGTLERLIKKVRANAQATRRWLQTKVLIIDEISMVSADLFDKLDIVARAIRNQGRPFGGIQLVITGDFLQLPPVSESNTLPRFAFESERWKECIQDTIGLTHIFRQKDPVLAQYLNEIRVGKVTDECLAAFQRLKRPLLPQAGLVATELFTVRVQADAANSKKLKELSGPEWKCVARDSGQSGTGFKECMAAEVLYLKVGAQVMLIKNFDDTLVNGSQGTVISFMGEGGRDEDGMEDALTATSTEAHKWPIVRFHVPGGTFREHICSPETWRIERTTEDLQASRTQVPLLLSWAMSVHKAQGMTFDRVKVNVGGAWAPGQTYVALSRATTQDGLEVHGFGRKVVKVHPKALGFNASLSDISKPA